MAERFSSSAATARRAGVSTQQQRSGDPGRRSEGRSELGDVRAEPLEGILRTPSDVLIGDSFLLEVSLGGECVSWRLVSGSTSTRGLATETQAAAKSIAVTPRLQRCGGPFKQLAADDKAYSDRIRRAESSGDIASVRQL